MKHFFALRAILAVVASLILSFLSVAVRGGEDYGAVIGEPSYLELPELQVNAKNSDVLHILGYVREYSTLTTYSDTVALFREKWVDFMAPAGKKKGVDWWLTPRILSSKSYYRFSDSSGLDSVSDRFNQHFSWSDWVGLVDSAPLPDKLRYTDQATDTLLGRYSATEIWSREGDDVTLDINVLADTLSRKWVPNIHSFFRNGTDFERFDIKYRFSQVQDSQACARDITSFSFKIESQGRGRDAFRFGRRDEPYFVTTYAETYIADQEYISVKEARKWQKRGFLYEDLLLSPPENVPALSVETADLIARVERIDHVKLKLEAKGDKRLAGLDLTPMTRTQKALKYLKGLFGI